MTVARVLFVDDEPKVLDGIRRSMREFSAEWESLFAGNGDEALSLLAGSDIHVVVTDIAMPAMDGKTLITRLYDSYPEVIALVLSGHWTPGIAAQQLGPAVRFLAKPASREQLVTAIRDALGEVRLPLLASRPAASLSAPSHRIGHDPSWLDLADGDF